jgi:dolichyl-phosphate beta-glucosyltransferase
LFTKNSYRLIFGTLHLERWAFDVEVFMIGNHYKMPVSEMPVNWHDVEGKNVIEKSLFLKSKK